MSTAEVDEVVAPMCSEPGAELRPSAVARRRIDQLMHKKHEREKRSVRMAREFKKLNAYLELAPKVTVALERLSEQLFEQLLGTVQEKLTIALQEILEQPIVFRAEADFKRKGATVEFWIERDGKREDVLKGQGGSVANILSVGLRMFALATLDPDKHRRFLVLDEQDCWLRPDLVPRLIKIVHDAGKALGFQVLIISHHDVSAFEQYADKIYQFIPTVNGVEVKGLSRGPANPDEL